MENRPDEQSQECERMPADALRPPRAINGSHAPLEYKRETPRHYVIRPRLEFGLSYILAVDLCQIT